MTQLKEYIAYLIVLLLLASRVGHPILEGRKKKFSITPPPPKPKKTISIDDIFAGR